MLTSTPLFLGGMPGGMELALILLIAVLLFGANKIPKLARSTGQAMGEFQRGREEIEQELEDVRDGSESASEAADADADADADVDADAATDVDAEPVSETDSTKSSN